MTRKTVIQLAYDLVIDNDYQSRINECKSERHLQSNGLLGDAWYRGFMTRHKDKLSRKGSTVKDVKRSTWVTRENFESMYENIYESMVEAGIAEKVEEEIQYEAGHPSHYVLTKPEYLVFVDETGCNTNQLNDGRVGGESFIVAKDDPEAAPRGATTDINFTVLAFITGIGEPLMCAVIFKSELPVSEIPLSWKLGIDITVEDLEDRTIVMKGGPCCIYNGNDIPFFYGTAQKASITSALLTEMLKFIDECGVFDRSIAKPFLLLDGHGSRMMLPFLKYIHQPANEWMCCIGVPYATHIWQVGDASGFNGAFKIALAKAKREYIKHRGKPTFKPTDLIPLLNKAWEKSFKNKKNAVSAIAHRGWNPLNYNLLDNVKPAGTTSTNAIDLAAAPKDDANQDPIVVLRPNISKGVGSLLLEKIIEEERKSDGHMEKFKKMKIGDENTRRQGRTPKKTYQDFKRSAGCSQPLHSG